MTRKRLSIIVNPVAGRGRVWHRLRSILDAWPYPDWEPGVHVTGAPGDAGRFAAGLMRDPPERVAVCGGDGTLNELASAVPEPACPIALIPAGTANVLAHELNIPLDAERAVAAAVGGTVQGVDLGRIEGRRQRCFLLMAGAGLDAFIVSRTSSRLKGNIGMASYYLSAIHSLLTYSFPEFEVETEREGFRASSCIIANAHSYGGGLVLTPDADIRDGLFDVLVIQGKPKILYLRVLVRALMRRPRAYPWARVVRAGKVSLAGPAAVPLQADGESAGGLPVEITLVPRSFPLVVPPESLSRRLVVRGTHGGSHRADP